MGTTAQKLQAIENSKTAIKNAISSKGVEITDNTLLSEYASKIDSIQTSIDTVTVTSHNGATWYSDNTVINFTDMALEGKKIDFSQTSTFTDFDSFFNGSSASSVPYFNTSNSSSFASTFANTANLKTIPLLDTSNATYFGYTFYHATGLTSIPLLDTSNCTRFDCAFQGCTSLTTVPLLDTSNATRMNSVFSGCTNITELPNFNTSKNGNFAAFVRNMSKLTSLPAISTERIGSSATVDFQLFAQNDTALNSVSNVDFSNVGGMSQAFQGAFAINTDNLVMDTVKVTSFSQCFQSARMRSFTTLKTDSATNCYRMFRNASRLTTLPALNMANVTNTQDMFTGCSALTTLPALNGLVKSITLSACPLSSESLVGIFNSLGTPSTTQTITIGNTNRAKLTEQEIAIATAKNWNVA